MSDWPASGEPPRVIITHCSPLSVGVDLAAVATAAPAGVAHGTVNLARLFPFVLPEPMVVVKLFAYNGATMGGNTDVGIYTEDGTRIVSSGAVLQAGASTIQEFDITDTVIGRGRYYAALLNTTTTATFFSNAVPIVTAKLIGFAQVAVGAGALPATLTPAAVTAAIQPLFGLSGRTLVV